MRCRWERFSNSTDRAVITGLHIYLALSIDYRALSRSLKWIQTQYQIEMIKKDASLGPLLNGSWIRRSRINYMVR